MELLNDLRLGQDVELVATARVVSKGFGHVSKATARTTPRPTP
jgi:hypothetical protein